MKKLTLLAAAAAGYVLGSRAGRERYEQIKTQATRAWTNPKVQSAVDDVQAQARQTGTDVAKAAGSKVADVAGDVKDKVVDAVRSTGSDDAEPSSTVGPGRGTA